MGLRVHRELLGETLILSLEGRLDAEGGEDLELAFHEVEAPPRAMLLIDCADLAYASAAGLAKLKEVIARLPNVASLRLCGLRPEVKIAFDSAELRLPVLPSREEALSTQRLRHELALVDRVASILRPARVPPASLPEDFLDQAARLLGVAPEARRPTAPPDADAREQPARATWVAERPSLLLRKAQTKKRHPLIRWLRRLIGERD